MLARCCPQAASRLGAVNPQVQGDSKLVCNQVRAARENRAVHRRTDARSLALPLTDLWCVLSTRRQVNGTWNVNKEHLAPYHAAARDGLAQVAGGGVSHVPRHLNSAADRMSNVAMDQAQGRL